MNAQIDLRGSLALAPTTVSRAGDGRGGRLDGRRDMRYHEGMMNDTPTPTRRQTGTPADAYAAKRAEVRSLMARLERQLAQHAATFEADPTSWGYAGDLDSVRNGLRTALGILTGQEV
jgi:hypothetical protein